MKQPDFWYNDPTHPGILARLLSPFGHLSAALTARRIAQGPQCSVNIPVICVGNLNLGGTGKTPVVIALIEQLAALGKAAHVLSRGYGGSIPGPVLVDPSLHSADETGDEPLLLAAFAPVWVGRDRCATAKAAADAGADVLIMDDGFQNPALARDLSILVVDAQRRFGNERCFPAGPLREPVATGLSRADAIVSVGSAPNGLDGISSRQGYSGPFLSAKLHPLQTGMSWEGARVFAFAGIGHPDKFFATLRDLGAEVAGTVALDDHQPISSALAARLIREADRLKAQIVTTEKDAVRLPQEFRRHVLAVPVRLEFDDKDALIALLGKVASLGQ